MRYYGYYSNVSQGDRQTEAATMPSPASLNHRGMKNLPAKPGQVDTEDL